MRELIPRILWVLVACWACCAAAPYRQHAYAQSAALGRDGLAGGRHVGSANVEALGLRGVISLAFAHTEAVLAANDAHERLSAELSAAWVARAWLQLSVRLDNRYDSHRGDHGSDSGILGSPELSTRHAFALPHGLSVAGQLRLRLPAGSAAGRSFRAATTELSGLLSKTLFGSGELTLQLGYRFDRSYYAFQAPDRLSEADALAAALSRYDAALVGVLLAVPLRALTLVGEASWEPYVGDGAPRATQSPMRLRAAVQKRFGERLLPGLELGTNLEGRRRFDPTTRVEPRMWAAISLTVLLDRARPKAATPTAAPAAPPGEPQLPARGVIAIQLIGPDQAPVAGADVVWLIGETRAENSTNLDGLASIEAAVGSVVRVSAVAPGLAAVERMLSVTAAKQTQIVRLEQALPEGEIKGKVRSFHGGPLKATIELLPDGARIESDQQGTFQLSVPPGDYQLRVSAPGHVPQERKAHVEQTGVTILVIDLRKTVQ